MFNDTFEIPKKHKKAVDLTSMIDVIFILLIFFMVSTTFSKLGVSINQPESSQAEKVNPTSVLVGITKEGAYIFEKEELTEEMLSQLIQAKIQQNKDMVIVLHPDKLTETQHLIGALDVCKEAGATQFSIATKKSAKH